MPDTTDTDRMQIVISGPMSRILAVHNPPRDVIDEIGDALKSLPGGDRPWEADDGTLSVEFDSRHQARAAEAYLSSLFPLAETQS